MPVPVAADPPVLASPEVIERAEDVLTVAFQGAQLALADFDFVLEQLHKQPARLERVRCLFLDLWLYALPDGSFAKACELFLRETLPSQGDAR